MGDDNFQGGYGLGDYHYNLGEELGAGNQGYAYGGNNGWSDSYGRAVAQGADPNKVTDLMGYGMRQGKSGADLATQRYQGLGSQWAGMQAPQLDLAQANGYMGMGDQSRMQQQQALGMMRARAMGQVPSVAQMQGNHVLAQGLNNTMSQVASARGGPGSMALAARGGMMGNAQMTGDVAGTSAIAAAQERNAAEQGYFGGVSGMRQQDYGAAGLAGQWAGQNAQLAGQNNQLRLQGQMGFEGMGADVQRQQLEANMRKQELMMGHWRGQAGLDQAYANQANPLTTIRSGGSM